MLSCVYIASSVRFIFAIFMWKFTSLQLGNEILANKISLRAFLDNYVYVHSFKVPTLNSQEQYLYSAM